MAKSTSRSIEVRLIKLLVAIACTALVGMLMILPYRLYERDIRHASEQAHRISSVAHVALARALAAGDEVNDLLNRFQGVAAFDIELKKLEDASEHPAAVTRRGTSDLDGTDLTYVAAPILDARGETWLATMHFDLSPMKRASIRLIIDLMLVVVLGSLAFSIVVFWLIRSSLVQPLRRVTRHIAQFEATGDPLVMPAFNTSEMCDLAEAVERACQVQTR
jgi:flagellar basal body-associated protein FliL